MPYLWLLQVAVHGLGDISRVNSIVIRVLAVVIFLNHNWEENRYLSELKLKQEGHASSDIVRVPFV